VVRKVFDAWLLGKMPERAMPATPTPGTAATTASAGEISKGEPSTAGRVPVRPDFSDVRGSADAVPTPVTPKASGPAH
jgi:hypothetical protein